MKEDLTKKDIGLIHKAMKLIGKTHIRNRKMVSDVVSIIVTEKGDVFYGADIEGLAPGSGICAETSAISNMILAGKGNDKIETCLALYGEPKYKKKIYEILPPCNKCRKNLRKFGKPWVFISKTKKSKLR
jgi:cytidine deaminase|tara:strand:+ start:82 stop:471 length:390 start_codon:yes stop_codon:yes gene_type:complete